MKLGLLICCCDLWYLCVSYIGGNDMFYFYWVFIYYIFINCGVDF